METAILSAIGFCFDLFIHGLERLGIRQPAADDPRPARAFPADPDARSRRPLRTIGLALVALLVLGLLFEFAGQGSADQLVFHFDKDRLVRAATNITVTAVLMIGLIGFLRRRA